MWSPLPAARAPARRPRRPHQGPPEAQGCWAQEGHAYGPSGAGSGSRFQMGGVLAVSRFGKVMVQFASAAVGDLPQEPYLDIIASDEQAAG